jgi:hypothetical protein
MDKYATERELQYITIWFPDPAGLWLLLGKKLRTSDRVCGGIFFLFCERLINETTHVVIHTHSVHCYLSIDTMKWWWDSVWRFDLKSKWLINTFRLACPDWVIASLITRRISASLLSSAIYRWPQKERQNYFYSIVNNILFRLWSSQLLLISGHVCADAITIDEPFFPPFFLRQNWVHTLHSVKLPTAAADIIASFPPPPSSL